jgi:hypothetical protein
MWASLLVVPLVTALPESTAEPAPPPLKNDRATVSDIPPSAMNEMAAAIWNA